MSSAESTIMASESSASKRRFVIGTRQSQLAMVQATEVLKCLQEAHPEYEFSIHGMTTKGDQVLDVALSKIGSKSLFTKELEVALADGTVDLVVHSLKDLQTVLPEGMVIGAIMKREDPRDAVVFSPQWRMAGLNSIAALPKGSVIGSSSVRRIAQLRRRFPHLVFQDVRGNLNTRLTKLDARDSPFSALLLAYAGLHRLGWDDRISQVLGADKILHAVGQGALGIECRKDDSATMDILRPLDHWETRLRCTAERSFMRYLEGGCSVPLGVWTTYDAGAKTLTLTGSVTSLDGETEIREQMTKSIEGESRSADLDVAERLGEELGAFVAERGAKAILEEIKSNRQTLDS
ncbi:porphobilinogen deaminase, dipyromethane cofactor binding domain-containing protein [Phlyctochytrium arcticum]|nr:porphobilinogen deaminase, dipyromethane cofactor binding domain-containing protein [Phlyctochytrium arcticum]